MTTPLSRLHLASLLMALPLSLAAFTVASAEPGTKNPQGNKKSSDDDQGMVLHLEVRRVPVDIVVTDKQGNPVKGLTKDDFTIKEDKKEQHILSFEYFDSAQTFTPPKLPPMPVNTYVNLPSHPEQGPLYILYYDMVNTATDDQMSFHKDLFNFIDNAQPGTRIAIFVNASGLHMLQGFTSDHELLKAALLSKGPGPHMPDVFFDGRIYGHDDAGAALSSLHFIADYMSGIPGRKNLLWLASDFPIPVGATVSGVNAQQGGVSGGFSSSTMQINDLSYLLQNMIKQTYAAFMRSQIALYPIEVGGIQAVDKGGGGGDTVAYYQLMDTVAAASGGHAYYANNHIEELIDKAVADGENYYSISYEPTNTKYDGLERDIDISLADNYKKSGYTLSYRTVYYGVSDDELQTEHKAGTVEARAQAKKAEDTLYANIEHGAPMLHDLVFSAHVATIGGPRLASAAQMLALEDSPAYFRTRRHDTVPKPLTPVKLQKYDIDYGVIDAELRDAANRKGAPATLEFAAAAYDNDGRLLNSMLNQGQVNGKSKKNSKDASKNSQSSDSVFHALQELEVPPGAAWIRLAVRDQLNNRTGTLEVRLPLKAETASAAQPAAPTQPAAAAPANPATPSPEPGSSAPASSGLVSPTTN
jgi:VWFA-related protein